ncbi:MAG: putative ABC transporter permease subunit [Melioribacteraceae bacterium]
MKQIAHILKFKIIEFLRLDTKFTFNSIAKSFGSSLIYIVFAAGGFQFVQKLFHFLIIEIKIGLFLLHEFISMILFIFFISVNVGNIIVSYSTLYKSNEINFFFTKPILPARIFAIKFLDNFFYSSSTLIMMLFSLLAGYVVYFKLSVGAFLLLVLNFIPLMFSAASLGVIILLLIIRSASRFGIKRIIYCLGSLYFLIIVFFFNLNSPKMLVTTVLRYYPFVSKDLYLGDLIPPLIKFLPNNWFAQSAYWLVRGDISFSLAYLLLQLVLSLLLFSAAIYLGHRWYFKTWLLNAKLNADFVSKRKESKSFFYFENKSFLKPQTESILKRDLLMFLREPSQYIHFLVLFFLIGIFIFSVSGIKFVGLGNYNLQTIIYLSLFLFNLLFISTLSLRFIFPLISLEGQAYWKMKSSPVQNNLFLRNKIVILGSFILLSALCLSFFSTYRFGTVLTAFSALISILAAITIISINFGMGGLYTNFKEKNAIRLSSSQGASLSFLINIVYMLFIVLVLYKPLSGLFLSIMTNQTFTSTTFYWSLIPIGIPSLILIITFLKIAADSIKKDF